MLVSLCILAHLFHIHLTIAHGQLVGVRCLLVVELDVWAHKQTFVVEGFWLQLRQLLLRPLLFVDHLSQGLETV